MKEACAIAIIGGSNGPTTIYIASNYNILFITFSVSIFLAIDIIILTVIKKIENQKVIKTKYIILIILNTIIALLVIPSMILIAMINNGIIVFTVIGKNTFQKYLKNRKIINE
jgi:Na+-transporting methylmalonyl-CoA/oxaloacetate decarboxylase beta subunit